MEINFNNIKTAKVLLRNQPAGLLKKEEDRYEFQYLQEYISNPQAIAIARSLPLQQQALISKNLHSFFDNLIAEGWLLECAEKILHIDQNNRFALLMATGKSPIGAVSIEPLDENGKSIDIDSIFKETENKEHPKFYLNILLDDFLYCPTCFKKLKEKKSHRKCSLEIWGTEKEIKIELNEKNPLQSFARVLYGGSISGAQKKGLFYLNDKTGILKPTAINAQYILKPDGNYPELPENEHITMAIARRIGFKVPPFTLLKIEKFGLIFVTKRFDRTKNNSALMLEDMGQILQTQSENKYNSSYEQVAKAIQKYSSAPILDLVDFFRRILFCYITANADMHLKNWSLLENENALGTFMLSPCYDLLNTRIPIPDERVDVALTMIGKARNLKKSYFKQFAENIKIPNSFIEKIFSEILDWRKIINELVPISLLSPESKKYYLEIINSRIEDLL